MMESCQLMQKQIQKPYMELLLNNKYLYCCTLNQHQQPHVVPLIFTFDVDKCLIYCVSGNNSLKVKNMRTNPFVTFTTDRVHPNVPFLNTGIMIESFVELIEDEIQIASIISRFQGKYDSLLDSRSLILNGNFTDVLIKARPIKIVYWKGPFFQRFTFKKYQKLVIPAVRH